MKNLITCVLAIVLHLILGWPWVILAAVIMGLVAGKRGWLVGLCGVGLAWLLLIGWNYIMAADAIARMMETMSNLIGGMLGTSLPAFVFLILTVLIGSLLGLLGGLIGTRLSMLLNLGPSSAQ